MSTPPRYHDLASRRLPGWLAVAVLTCACTTSPLRTEADHSSVDGYDGVRIVEVLSSSVDGASGAFVEIRNDGESTVSLVGWALRFGPDGDPAPLEPRQIPFSVEASQSADPALVPSHGLALVVDSAAPIEKVARAACEPGIATAESGLPAAQNKRQRENLVTTLLMQQPRHCIPVFTLAGGESLGARVSRATDVLLVQGAETRDRAQGPWAEAPLGVAFERRGLGAADFAASPIGSSPGARNFFGSDPYQLVTPGGRPPIEVHNGSPWRAGDLVQSLRREANAKLAEASLPGADADRLRAEAQELLGRVTAMQCEEITSAQDYARCKAERGEHLPYNPLVGDLDELVASAGESIVGSFYQINEHDVVDALVQAAGRVPASCPNPLDGGALGPCVQLTTDAAYFNDPSYVPGFDRLRAVGVPLRFDFGDNNQDRAPLSHNKFIVVDGEWVWTGSFNPIEDEPALIHADNALTLHSTALAALHTREFQTLINGQFGILKRDEGVGGGEAWIDGAQVEVRFSPGLTADQLARRGAALRAGQDACAVSVPATGAYVIEDRYRGLDPCGGPLDLLSAEVARATSSIYFGLFSFALAPVSDVIVERLGAGVEVKGIGDQTTASRGALVRINEAGGDVRFTPNSDPGCNITPTRLCPTNVNKVWFHHKFIIIDYGTDHPVVITGSHNMSDSAEDQNDETLVVVRDRAVAEAYYRIFREAFDHPQSIGPRRNTTDLPALAVTEVRASGDPDGAQFVEITNLGAAAASLDGLELWNRATSVALEGDDLVLEPAGRAVFVVGDDRELGIPESALVITTPPDADRPFVGLGTALVLRTGDGRWVATYDPYTSEQNLPQGAGAPVPGGSVEWLGFDETALASLTLELEGRKDSTDEGDRFTWAAWNPRGTFSEWLDEHDVTPSGLVLWKSASSPLTPAIDPAGSPGRDPLAPDGN
ncbi:MAG: hypothetical protein HYY06_18050 [Deltaproteobacteria bacterium]|nr:hypothetical protein [Deltaproteobacteria bacterium]